MSTGRTPDVIVVGAGVIGCAVAYEVAHAGAAVTVIDRGPIGNEASSAAAGIVAPRVHAAQGPVFGLALTSFTRFPALAAAISAASGIDPEWVASGTVEVAHDTDTAAELVRKVTAQQAAGQPVRWLDAAELRAVEPAITPGALGGFYDPEGAHVRPLQLTLALARAAERHGACFETGLEALALIGPPGRALGVRTTGGDRAAGCVVIATGAWANGPAQWLGLQIPVFPSKGQILSVGPFPGAPRAVIWDEAAYLLPRRDGSVVVGATVERVGYDKRVTAGGLGSLLRAAARLCPDVENAELQRAWAGLRPATPDDLPIIGRAPGWENVYMATGHHRNGITLAPITGELVARAALGGEEQWPAAVRPERFAHTTVEDM